MKRILAFFGYKLSKGTKVIRYSGRIVYLKSLFIAVALFASLSASALEIKLERVSYAKEKYGNQSERSAEVKFRNAKLAEYKKLGYTFDGMVTGANGKFMKFVK